MWNKFLSLLPLDKDSLRTIQIIALPLNEQSVVYFLSLLTSLTARNSETRSLSEGCAKGSARTQQQGRDRFPRP